MIDDPFAAIPIYRTGGDLVNRPVALSEGRGELGSETVYIEMVSQGEAEEAIHTFNQRRPGDRELTVNLRRRLKPALLIDHP